MNNVYRFILKRAMREAVKVIKVTQEDTDKDIVGKLFNHFQQYLNSYSSESWEVSRKVSRRMKKISSYSDLDTYVGKLLSAGLLEVNRLKRDNDMVILRSSLYSMRAMINEAERVNTKSEQVLNRLSEIERNIYNG